jgi:hypothetical protein
LFSNTLSPCASLNVRDLVSQSRMGCFFRFLATQNMETICSYEACVDFPGFHGVICWLIAPFITTSMRISNTQYWPKSWK